MNWSHSNYISPKEANRILWKYTEWQGMIFFCKLFLLVHEKITISRKLIYSHHNYTAIIVPLCSFCQLTRIIACISEIVFLFCKCQWITYIFNFLTRVRCYYLHIIIVCMIGGVYKIKKKWVAVTVEQRMCPFPSSCPSRISVSRILSYNLNI